jgi:serine/threonine-protein kinase ATR
LGQALLALEEKRDLGPILVHARRAIGSNITSRQYSRSHEPILQLHILREIELIHLANLKMVHNNDPTNRATINQNTAAQLIRTLQDRLSTTSASFRVTEAILSVRRTAFKAIKLPRLKPQVGLAWIFSSKIARKAGYEQSAYSAVLQAKEADAPFAFVQQAKLLRANGGVFKALTDLQNSISIVKKVTAADHIVDLTETGFQRERSLAKVSVETRELADCRLCFWKPDGQMRRIGLKRTLY